MELKLCRTYYPHGTNGSLYQGQQLLCHTIELPYKNNKRNVSCIPEGRYQLQKKVHPQHGAQIEISHVPGREAILIHPANDALLELRGCVAPVRQLSTEGKGEQSRVAFKVVEELIEGAFARHEEVWLRIMDARAAGIAAAVNKVA